ncbi:LEA type 2 family protein [Novilysobacter arseniciresistens]|uniref:LEA type 2 family protein n=1 Tax=Novilysobacter arseniciresistens TaxID=1385522 RepID=UPI00068AD25B|nr:LEA type 2 family protein [Lysobacter arseniciresistens]
MAGRTWGRWLAVATVGLVLAACTSGPVRRVSEPSARIQQLTVRADGNWSVDLRLENYSSIPMRFDAISLALEVDGHAAGTLVARPGITIGPESADVDEVVLVPSAAAKFAVAQALGRGEAVDYSLEGSVTATPDEAGQRVFDDLSRRSALSPAPGLPGVMR